MFVSVFNTGKKKMKKKKRKQKISLEVFALYPVGPHFLMLFLLFFY